MAEIAVWMTSRILSWRVVRPCSPAGPSGNSEIGSSVTGELALVAFEEVAFEEVAFEEPAFEEADWGEEAGFLLMGRA